VISPEDDREIAGNLTGFFRVLDEWARDEDREAETYREAANESPRGSTP
jgi:hypothetical protein